MNVTRVVAGAVPAEDDHSRDDLTEARSGASEGCVPPKAGLFIATLRGP